MKYLYYRDYQGALPFMKSNDYFITKVPSSKIKTSFIVSNTSPQTRLIPQDPF
jgi:hypothetical protein